MCIHILIKIFLNAIIEKRFGVCYKTFHHDLMVCHAVAI